MDESIEDGPQKRSERVNYTALHSGNLDDENSGLIHMYLCIKKRDKMKNVVKKRFWGKI